MARPYSAATGLVSRRHHEDLVSDLHRQITRGTYGRHALELELSTLKVSYSTLQEELQAKKEEIYTLYYEAETHQARLTSTEQDLCHARHEVSSATSEVAKAREDIKTNTKVMTELRNGWSQLELNARKLEGDKAHLQKLLKDTKAELESVTAKYN
jgi:chromosome segregation ATPase